VSCVFIAILEEHEGFVGPTQKLWLPFMHLSSSIYLKVPFYLVLKLLIKGPFNKYLENAN
jgi:hypothetical protein